MRMSIARALKERKRIIGEMNTLWNRIINNNLVQKNIRIVDGKYTIPSKEELAKLRRQDPSVLLNSWKNLQERLISLKVALHSANSGVAEKLARIAELKSELKQIECMSACTSTTEHYSSELIRVYDVVFDANWQTEVIDFIRSDINTLQDQIDEYNATHFIEIAD